MISRRDEEIDLAEAALLIAAEEYSLLDIGKYIEKLDSIGDLARENALGAHDAFGMISAINATLFEDLGFRGNRENYFDPRNSYLNKVIDSRMGIPITLTLVYMEVARRVGFSIQGVGMPGHFIARHEGPNGDIYIDPFNAGRVLGEKGCAELLASMSGGRVELKPEHLAAVTKKQMLTRMLTNLLNIYAIGDYHRALSVIERILLLNPDSPSHIRDHGLLLAALGKTGEALKELENYLDVAPDAPDADTIREQIKTIRQKRASLN